MREWLFVIGLSAEGECGVFVLRKNNYLLVSVADGLWARKFAKQISFVFVSY